MCQSRKRVPCRAGKGGERDSREAAAYPFRVSINRCDSPSISNILIVRSDEQVANRRP